MSQSSLLLALLLAAVPVQGASDDTAAPAPRLVEGLGTSSIDPDSSDPQARAWFAQGERLVWAFDEPEAVRAFRQAQRLDPECALCFWGEAWALKPTINLRLRFEEAPAARAAAEKAKALARGLSQRDRMLVEAMEEATRQPLFGARGYAAALEAGVARFPDDLVLPILAAEAHMSASDWRTFRPGSAAQKLLERALRHEPDHGGAIHLYIHLTDWIGRPDLAEPHADRLAAIAPAASHLQHMPAHAYFGLGRYADAIAANRAAARAHYAFLAAALPEPSGNRERLLAHSNYFGVLSAIAAGDEEQARGFLEALRSMAAPAHDAMHHRMVALADAYVDAAHGPVDKVVARPDSPRAQPFDRILRHYARGEALARAGDTAGTAAEVEALSKISRETGADLTSRPERRLATIFEQVLRGRTAMLAGDPAAAVAAFRAASEAQFVARAPRDPPDYWYSTRRSLAEALLVLGDAAGAAKEARLSLKEWPNDSAAKAVLDRVAINDRLMLR